MFLSIITAVICIFKYYYKFYFFKGRGHIYPHENIVNHQLGYQFLIEFCLILIHPSPFILHQSFSQVNYELKLEINYFYNDVCVIIVLLRNIIHFVDVFRSTKYNSSRIQRINMLFNNKKLNPFLGMKNFVANNLFRFMVYSLILSVFFFSSLIIITERQISILTNKELINWSDVVWYTVVTMTTIGYGDKVANTLISRLIIMIVVIWGNFWSSILLSSLFPYIQLNVLEEKAFNLLNRLKIKKKIKNVSSSIISTFLKILVSKNKEIMNIETIQQNRNNLNKLNKLIKMKSDLRRIYEVFVAETKFFPDDILTQIEQFSNLSQEQLLVAEKIETKIIELIKSIKDKLNSSQKEYITQKIFINKLSLNNIIKKDSYESQNIDSFSNSEENVSKLSNLNQKSEIEIQNQTEQNLSQNQKNSSLQDQTIQKLSFQDYSEEEILNSNENQFKVVKNDEPLQINNSDEKEQLNTVITDSNTDLDIKYDEENEITNLKQNKNQNIAMILKKEIEQNFQTPINKKAKKNSKQQNKFSSKRNKNISIESNNNFSQQNNLTQLKQKHNLNKN